jgi:hypothetical protein
MATYVTAMVQYQLLPDPGSALALRIHKMDFLHSYLCS